MADEQLIKPRELPAATTVFADDAIMTDNGSIVGKATPVQIVNAGAPVPTEAEAIAGADNSKRMTPLTVKQVLDSVTAPSVLRAQAWAESDSPPDPGIPGSQSAKSWAAEAERLGAEQADRAEAAAADTVNNAPFSVNTVADFLAKTSLALGGVYSPKVNTSSLEVLASGGDYTHPITGQGVKVHSRNGWELEAEAFGLVAGPLGNPDKLQEIVDLAWDLGASLILLPKGDFYHNGLKIKSPRSTSGHYGDRVLHLKGGGRGTARLIHNGTGPMVEFVPSSGSGSCFGGIVTSMSLIGGSGTTHGILFPRGTNFRTDDLYITGVRGGGLRMPDDHWINMHTNIFVSGAAGENESRAIWMSASGTTNFFTNIFASNCKNGAYKIVGSYSNIGSLAADNCSGGSLYDLDYFSGSIGSLGSEMCDCINIVRAGFGCVSIGFILSFRNELSDTKGVTLNAFSGDVSVNKIDIHHDTVTTVAQQLYRAYRSKVIIGSVRSNVTFTVQSGRSDDNASHAIWQDLTSGLGMRLGGSRAFLGFDRRAQASDEIPNTSGVRSVAIFLDSLGSPRYTSDGMDRRYQVGAKPGDWFIEARPDLHHTAGYVSRSDTSDLATTNPGRIVINLTGTTANRPSVNLWVGLTYFDTTLGKPIRWNGTTWVDADGAVAAIKYGATANRPSGASTGYQYFDTTLGKPVWWNGTAWVDATGTAA